jgi:hypothetical protein
MSIRELLAQRLADDSGEQTPAETLGDVLSEVLDVFVYADSYGVYGSDFHCCMACNAGGSPTRKFEHTAECLAGKLEAILFAEFDAAESCDQVTT